MNILIENPTMSVPDLEQRVDTQMDRQRAYEDYNTFSPPTWISSSRELLQLSHLLHLLPPLFASVTVLLGTNKSRQIFDAPQPSHLAQELLERKL